MKIHVPKEGSFYNFGYFTKYFILFLIKYMSNIRHASYFNLLDFPSKTGAKKWLGAIVHKKTKTVLFLLHNIQIPCENLELIYVNTLISDHENLCLLNSIDSAKSANWNVLKLATTTLKANSMYQLLLNWQRTFSNCSQCQFTHFDWKILIILHEK